MPNKRFVGIIFALLIILIVSFSGSAWAWSNGSYSNDPAHPSFGTHDWIAQHALDWLPTNEKQFFADHLASYLYGTELPDNKNTPGGVGDASAKHHIYFYANGLIQDDSSAVRAKQEYQNAMQAYSEGNMSSAAMHLGMVTHYIDDMGVFGHVMGSSTAWGSEIHHSDYESYVGERTNSYSSDFDVYLSFDGVLKMTLPYDAALALANDTTFDQGGTFTCIWMDQHYDWSSNQFRTRCGESLNLAVNAVSEVLHCFANAEFALASPSFSQPTSLITQTPSIPEISSGFALEVTLAVAVVVLAESKILLKKYS